jgi:hypothetical protein
MNSLKSHRFFKWGLVIAIVIILNLFFIFSIQLVYEKPEWENFCGDPQVRIVPQTQDECLAVGGQWTDDKFAQKGLPHPDRIEPPAIEVEREGYCNSEYTCGKEFDEARKEYERNVFMILIILGVATLTGSYLLRAHEVVATAFSAGGVLALVIASIRYWSDMDDYLRVIVLGIALAALIWAGIKKFK